MHVGRLAFLRTDQKMNPVSTKKLIENESYVNQKIQLNVELLC